MTRKVALNGSSRTVVVLFATFGCLHLVSVRAPAQGRPDIVWMAGGHSDDVYSVAYSPDGRMFASGAEDATVKLWRLSDGKLIRTLRGNGWDVYSVAFSPNGKLLASGSSGPNLEGAIHLWRVSDGSLIRTLTGYKDEVLSVAFSPDGRLLASGSSTGRPRYKGVISVWRVSDGSLIHTLKKGTGRVRSVAFSPDGRRGPGLHHQALAGLGRVADPHAGRTHVQCAFRRRFAGWRNAGFGE